MNSVKHELELLEMGIEENLHPLNGNVSILHQVNNSRVLNLEKMWNTWKQQEMKTNESSQNRHKAVSDKALNGKLARASYLLEEYMGKQCSISRVYEIMDEILDELKEMFGDHGYHMKFREKIDVGSKVQNITFQYEDDGSISIEITSFSGQEKSNSGKILSISNLLSQRKYSVFKDLMKQIMVQQLLSMSSDYAMDFNVFKESFLTQYPNIATTVWNVAQMKFFETLNPYSPRSISYYTFLTYARNDFLSYLPNNPIIPSLELSPAIWLPVYACHECIKMVFPNHKSEFCSAKESDLEEKYLSDMNHAVNFSIQGSGYQVKSHRSSKIPCLLVKKLYVTDVTQIDGLLSILKRYTRLMELYSSAFDSSFNDLNPTQQHSAVEISIMPSSTIILHSEEINAKVVVTDSGYDVQSLKNLNLQGANTLIQKIPNLKVLIHFLHQK